MALKKNIKEDEAHSWEEYQEYSSMISDPCLFFDLYRTIFGENHWAEKHAFEKSEDGCPEINQHFFKHSIDDSHRLGSLRKLYRVLRQYSGEDPLSKKTIKKAIGFRMPTKMYKDNFDLFRFLVLLKENPKNVNYIHQMQDKIVKIDKSISNAG